MPSTGKRLNKLTVYLIKEEADVERLIKSPNSPITIEGIGNFYYAESDPKRPSWLQNFFINRLAEAELPITSANAQGLLIVPIETEGGQRYFALTFGHGRHLLQPDVVEERFGLKIVLNSVDPDSLRNINKTTLGSIPKHSREQMSRAVNASQFGIDVEQDLVSSVTAKSLDENFGTMPTGSDALSVSVPVDLENLKDFLSYCYDRSNSTDYKRHFGWIDYIHEVRDRKKLADLDEMLVEKIAKNELEKIWMAVPTLIDWIDVEGFTYRHQKSQDLYSDIGIDTFLESLEGKPVTPDVLRSEPVYLIHESNGAADSWTAYQCLYAEIANESETFLLTAGKWYEVTREFVEEVNTSFNSLPESKIDFPVYDHENEAAYNIDAAKQLKFASLDKSNILHGGGQSKIEFCDLYTPAKQMIYVKKYSASSVLSHLFAQGSVAAELFVADASFRTKLNKKFPKDLALSDPNLPIEAKDYEVVYAIISFSKKELNIPFFSKVSLKNSRQRLLGFGYKVSIKKIESAVAKKKARKTTLQRSSGYTPLTSTSAS